MKWSKLKKMIEERFAPSVAGRVHVYRTWYRNEHGQDCGRAWITIDGEELANFCEDIWRYQSDALAHELHDEGSSSIPYEEAAEILMENGVLARHDVTEGMKQLLQMPIEDALLSKNPVIRGLAALDRRVGRRRLARMNPTNESNEVARRLLEFRKESEGLSVESAAAN